MKLSLPIISNWTSPETPQKPRKGHRAFMGFRHRPPLVRRTLTGLSFNLTSSSYFSIEFHQKVSQSSATQNDRDGSGFELMGVAGVGSNGLRNGIDFGELECSMKGLMRMMKVKSCQCCEGVWLGVLVQWWSMVTLGQWWSMIKGGGGF
ncbi:hypothetical protein V6N11_062030 [Hibiscus sabdariffa]|uniref:Uncharacterized protein n=1 Tax=Hibiscus sabdariffa TaxID=183260 RepID=A0ABR2PRK7_9ROSI